MQATITKRPSAVFQISLGVAAFAFPIMVSVLFNAGAEAFFGDKEPIFQTASGLAIGVGIAGVLGTAIYMLDRSGWAKLAWSILIAIIAFDVAAMPLAGWLIRQAYASPTNVIDWW